MKILMVASFGGHFIQLRRLYRQIEKQVIEGEVVFKFATTEKNLDLNSENAYYFPNVHRGSGAKEIF